MDHVHVTVKQDRIDLLPPSVELPLRSAHAMKDIEKLVAPPTDECLKTMERLVQNWTKQFLTKSSSVFDEMLFEQYSLGLSLELLTSFSE